ncbi:hypothetical protein SUGI_0104090 [Cryptomeria japonica]|nr:hypothetical protein SUGI_0104090 [Cryptomeria japonica]
MLPHDRSALNCLQFNSCLSRMMIEESTQQSQTSVQPYTNHGKCSTFSFIGDSPYFLLDHDLKILLLNLRSMWIWRSWVYNRLIRPRRSGVLPDELWSARYSSGHLKSIRQ